MSGQVLIVDIQRNLGAAWPRASKELRVAGEESRGKIIESVKITGSGALEWPGELDLCPDSIYMRLTGKTPEQIFPLLKKQFAYA